MKYKANADYKSTIVVAGSNKYVVLEKDKEYEFDLLEFEAIERDYPGLLTPVKVSGKKPAADRQVKKALNRMKKDELLVLAGEMGLSVSDDVTVKDLRSMISKAGG